MRPLSDLERLTETQKLELVRQLHAELQHTHTELAQATAEVTPLAARVAELEQAASVPPKTPGNSSVPPYSSPEPSVPKGRRRRKRKGPPGRGWRLHPAPDKVVNKWLTDCPECRADLRAVEQKPHAVYDRIKLALHAGDQVATATRAVRGGIRAEDQRGHLGQPVPASPRVRDEAHRSGARARTR